MMTNWNTNEMKAPPESSAALGHLLLASDQEFEEGIARLDVRDLLQLISCLQYEMAMEQQRFDTLTSSFKEQTGEFWEADPLISSSLCQSQIRLAQLCTRNMRCFTQQAARAQQDRTSSLQQTQSTPSEPNLISTDMILRNLQTSSTRVRTPSPPPNANSSPFRSHYSSFQFSNRKADENFYPEERTNGQWGVRMKVRAPSVEDILKNVRSLRLEKDNDSASSDEDACDQHSPSKMTPTSVLTESDVHIPSRNYGNEYDLVPTATQLLLRTKSSPTKSLLSEFISETHPAGISNGRQKVQLKHDDSICLIGSDPPGVSRSVLSCPDFQSTLSNEIEISDDQSLLEGNLEVRGNDAEEDDDDSGMGADEQPKLNNNQKKSRRRLFHGDHFQQHPQHSGGMENISKTERESISLSVIKPNSNNNVMHAPESEEATFDDEDDDNETDHIPPVITYPLPEAEAFRRQKGTSVQWNPNRLLEELYAIPSPKPPATPPTTFINMEGYLEKLPSGRRQATFWNAWKRRYFRIRDGHLFCYASAKSEEPSVMLQLMGGKVDTVETTLLGIDDGKGHYVVVRCGSRADTERWRRALITHTAENYSLMYVQPVVAYPQFYEDVLIIDVGSCSLRAGILCNQPTLPQVYFPTVCATDKTTGERVYGKEALRPKTRLGASITFPLRPSAKITKFSVDIEVVKGLLSKVFYDLNVDPSDYQVQLSLPRNFPFRSQTDVLDLLMTEFGVRAVNLTAQTVLALCSYNSTSGIVVDIGERMEVIPIVDGYVIEPGVSRFPYGGTRLLDHLRHFLMQSHYGLASETESFLLRYVLEHSCYVAEHYNTELQKFYSNPEKFEVALPVSQFFEGDSPWETITLDSGRFQAPEGLFKPDVWGLDNPGLHKLVSKAIQECSLDVRKEMSKSIYLSGGVTMLPGFAARLQQEMDLLTPPTTNPKVHASPFRAHSAYLGACILAASPGFHEAKVSRDDWIAHGSSCLKKWHF